MRVLAEEWGQGEELVARPVKPFGQTPLPDECQGCRVPRGVVPFSRAYPQSPSRVDGIGDRLEQKCPFSLYRLRRQAFDYF
jgi:hypothetical protein